MKASSGLLFLALAVLCVAARGADINELPVAQCAYWRVLKIRSLTASNQWRETQRRIGANRHQIQSIEERHPESRSGVFLGFDYLTKDERAESDRLWRQNQVQRLYALAESRRARDADVMVNLIVAAAAIRDGAKVPPEGTPESWPYAYLSALGNALTRSHAPDHPDNLSPTQCSVDLALQIEAGTRRVKEAYKLMSTPEHLQHLGWRATYGFPEGAPFNSARLSATDAARLLKTEAIFRAQVERMRAFGAAVGAIRFFADMSDIQYNELKSEALQLIRSNDHRESARLRDERHAKLSEHMQAVWDFWSFVNSQVISEEDKSQIRASLQDINWKYPLTSAVALPIKSGRCPGFVVSEGRLACTGRYMAAT